jgi:hypothetical protein
MLRGRLEWIALFAIVASAAYACGGDEFEVESSGASSNAGGNGTGGNTGGMVSTGSGVGASVPVDCNDPPLFETDIVPIFESSCGTGDDMCHSRVAFGADMQFGCRGWLSLENEAIGSVYYAGMNVGQSTGCSDMPLYDRLLMDAWQCGAPGNPSAPFKAYVSPCDPESSYMLHKMTGGQMGAICEDENGVVFDPMPQDLEPIQAQIDLVYAWIEVGAPTLANPQCTCGNNGEGGSGAGGPGGQNPSPNLEHPGDMEVRPANMAVPFIGSATDPQDGDIPGSSLFWASNLDGPLNGGNPSAMFDQVLSIGTHTLTLEAEDSDGNFGSTSITLYIE